MCLFFYLLVQLRSYCVVATKQNPVKKTSSKETDKEVFGLPQQFKRRIRECAEEAATGKEQKVVFLWACVSETGLKPGVKSGKQVKKSLTQQEWLTVVDEAASLGANWFVLSFSVPLADREDIWAVCKWAQDVHGMMVGLHVKTPKLTRKDVDKVKQLSLKKTRVLAREGALSRLKLKEEEKNELIVWTANPQADGERPNCQGPTRMIFINAQGMLYTCGLVDGNETYRMGHVFDKKLKNVMSDPDLPHHVHEEIHYVTPECDGCPALIANYFSENM
jgi:radical SAM protein with 4Fe4S-binding SPASM domain